jgi:hypothetical protein
MRFPLKVVKGFIAVYIGEKKSYGFVGPADEKYVMPDGSLQDGSPITHGLFDVCWNVLSAAPEPLKLRVMTVALAGIAIETAPINVANSVDLNVIL